MWYHNLKMARKLTEPGVLLPEVGLDQLRGREEPEDGDIPVGGPVGPGRDIRQTVSGRQCR